MKQYEYYRDKLLTFKRKNGIMTEQEIKAYIKQNFPCENESCDWKNYANLKNTLCGHEGDDVVSYVSALSNVNGGALVIGVEDKTLDIVGIQDFANYTPESAKYRIVEKCRNLNSVETEGGGIKKMFRNFDDSHYKDMILNYIKKYKKASKSDIGNLIVDKLSPVLSDKQKQSKVSNLLSSLRIDGKIECVNRFWVIKKN